MSMLTRKDNLKNEVKNNKTAKNSSSEQHEDHPSGCCQPSQQHSKTSTASPAQQQHSHESPTEKHTSVKTRITVKYNVGFSNQLYIRGKGANLSWNQGQLLKNTQPDEWVWETDASCNHGEFKILINDRIYENGDNHPLNTGSILSYTPHFY